MDKPSFVYVTYIRATREKVWQALTDPTIVPTYWFGHRIESDWVAGGPLRFFEGDQLVHDDILLECDPPSRLSYSWRPLKPRFAGEPASRVTFILEEHGPQVKLTMRHEELEAAGAVLPAVSNGWPAVLSGLKTLLETGAPLAGMRPPARVEPSEAA